MAELVWIEAGSWGSLSGSRLSAGVLCLYRGYQLGFFVCIEVVNWGSFFCVEVISFLCVSGSTLLAGVNGNCRQMGRKN